MCCIRWVGGPYKGLGYLPALLGALMISAIVTTYLVATYNNHVEAFFPYISDTGVELPERCIFSQFFNLAAMMGVIVMYLRYKLIRALTEDRDYLVTALAKLNLFFAIFSCLGLSMVANFQETGIEPAHLTGAMLVFGLGVAYAFTDSFITYRMHPTYNGRPIYIARFFVGLLGLISLLISIIAGTISRYQWAERPPKHARLHWDPEDPGFTAHLLSTFGEWAMAASFLFYYITFIRDFQRFSVEVKPTLYVAHLDEPPSYLNDDLPDRIMVPPEDEDPDESSPLLA